ncbi:MAG: asparaginase domain-containing protein [Thermovirgaceae bacterium]
MKQVSVLLTGGTIASGFGLSGKEPKEKAASRLKDYLSDFFDDKGAAVLFREPWGTPGLDSSNLDPGHWYEMAKIIAEDLSGGSSGFLVLHGTDTMAYTAAWLALCFWGAGVPVILTGSQLTLDYTPDDVTVNIRGAAQALCSKISGVWVYCNWKLIQGVRVHKARASHPDAFVPVNSVPLFFNPEWAQGGGNKHTEFPGKAHVEKVSESLRTLLSLNPETLRERASRARWLFCAPGSAPYAGKGERILLLFGFGAGNVPASVLENIRMLYKANVKPVIIACSQAEGDVKDPSSYSGVGAALLAQDGFEVYSQMDYPFEFIHALSVFALAVDYENPGKVLAKFLKLYGSSDNRK